MVERGDLLDWSGGIGEVSRLRWGGWAEQLLGIAASAADRMSRRANPGGAPKEGWVWGMLAE